MTDSKRGIFAAAHHGDRPLLLYNAWDAGSAQAIAQAGASAIATGSLGLAGAHGFSDGQVMPLENVLAAARTIVAAVDLPVSVDFEGGYADAPADLVANAAMLAETGADGCNFEDQIVGGTGIHPIALQAERIAAVASSGLFVNARTDLFLAPLMRGEDPNQNALVDQALERAAAYKAAGAECFFVPGLSDERLIRQLCAGVDMPVNIMVLPGVPDLPTLRDCGVARVSWGPGPWRTAMEKLRSGAAAVFSQF